MALHKRLSILHDVYKEFSRDHGFLLAAAVSFYAFLSLFPLLLMAVGVLGFILRSPAHAEDILTHLLGHFVVGHEASDVIYDVIHGRSAATGIGMVLLFWSGTSAFVVLEQAMNLAWNAKRRRGYFRRRAVAFLTLISVGILLALSIASTAILHALRASSPDFLNRLSWAWGLLGIMIPAVMSVMLFALLYKLLPFARVTWLTSIVGGLFAGTLWEIAKHAFTFYVVHWAGYNKIYGSLASVILLLVWIDYSAIITILGAEFASVWSTKRRQMRTRRSLP